MATTVDDLAKEAQKAYDDAKKLAENALKGSDNGIEKAISAAERVIVTGAYAGGYDPKDAIPRAIPLPALPTTDFSVDVRTAFDHAFSQFNSSIQPQVLNYLDTFFPDIAQAVKTGSDNWIIDTIANGRFVPVEVEDAIWNRARDRELQENSRQEKSLVEAYAARGFDSPNGVLTATLSANQQESSKRLSAISRDISIKSFDVANENTKSAIQQAVALRTAFVGALGDFIKTAMVQPSQATDYAKLILASKTGLYDSAVNLYRARISEEQMRTSVELENRGLELKSDGLFVESHLGSDKVHIERAQILANTAMQAAENLSRVAAGAMATRNSMVSVSAGI